MPGPRLTQVLAAGDYDTFHAFVRDFNHDTINRISRISNECAIVTRIVEKFPPEDIFTDPRFHPETASLAREARALMAATGVAARYFDLSTDNETANRENWHPYDARAWDSMVETYFVYLLPHLDVAPPLSDHLLRLEEAKAIRIDGRSAPLGNARRLINAGLTELEWLLTPESWESLIDEWLERHKRLSE
jgi:hypothetical protein